MIKKASALLLAMVVTLLLGIASPAAKAAESFSDVPAEHWAYSSIVWAAKEGVVSGYPDGTFRPSQQVTEAEFITMLIRAFDKLEAPKSGTHWAQPAYEYAIAKNWPVVGVEEGSSVRNTATSRGKVAEIIASAQGINVSMENAVQFLLNEGLASGKTGEKTVDGYKPDDFLTRAEVVQFIKNMKDAGVEELRNRPTIPGGTVEPNVPGDVPKEISNMVGALEKIVESGSAYNGTKISYGETSASVVVTSNNKSLASYMLGTAEYDTIAMYDATKATSRDLGLKMLEATGVKVTKEIKDAVHAAPDLKVAKDMEFTTGGVKVIVSPHPTDVNRVMLYVYNN